jgi:hypothetical protein
MGRLEEQARVEGRFLLSLILALAFLWVVGAIIALSTNLGTWGLVLIVLALVVIGAAIVWELSLFWRRYRPR